MGFRGARSWDVYMRIVSIGSYMLVFEKGQAPHSTELVSLRFCTRIVTLYSSPIMARALLPERSSPALPLHPQDAKLLTRSVPSKVFRPVLRCTCSTQKCGRGIPWSIASVSRSCGRSNKKSTRKLGIDFRLFRTGPCLWLAIRPRKMEQLVCFVKIPVLA